MARRRQAKRRSAGRRRVSRSRRASKAARGKRRHRPAPPKPAPKPVDPRIARALKDYAVAMRYFNRQNYRRAKRILETLTDAPSRELAERARVHLNICEQQLQRPERPKLKTGDDYYFYGVSLTNLHQFDEARAALEKARKLLPKADYVYYALASLAALASDADEAFENLSRAIRLRPENRFQARNDPDLKSLETDPRFTELLYPERTVTA